MSRDGRTPQDTVERALAAARPGGDCVVIADESSTANLRWAGNTLTTNGVAASRILTVISIDRRADGTAGVGIVSRSGVTPDQVEDLVREAEKAAEQASRRRGRERIWFAETAGVRSDDRIGLAAQTPRTSECSAASRRSSGRRCGRPRAPGASCTASPSTG